MFGYVAANQAELSKEQKERYRSVYCGICRRIATQAGGAARMTLSYDMAFLALLHMSLYEPEERIQCSRCAVHPGKSRPWVDNEFIRYAADMNVALAYYNFQDDWEDDRKQSARMMAKKLQKHLPNLEEAWPRQCAAIRDCLGKLSRLEKESCPNPDAPAGVFGDLMGELLVCREDLWAEDLRQVGFHLGRLIYLTDAAQDYDRDKRQGKYNPYAAMGMEKDPALWRQHQVLAMARCTAAFERLPLVQDKALLNNILYSGVWTYPQKKGGHGNDGRSV